MKQSVLPLLACPHALGSALCGGMLTVSSSAGLPTRLAADDPDELLEGILRCGSCGTEHPVLCGVALLVPRPEEYLRKHQDAILRDIDRHAALPPAARSWLTRRYGGARRQEEYGADFRYSQQFEDPWAVAQAMTENPEALYGPFAGWLRQASGAGPYDVLSDWAQELVPQRHLALDAGCGGGGLLARLAPRFASAFGVDYSFLAILLARRALLHRPEPERTYCLTLRRGQETERPLRAPRLDHSELVVADCAALPFSSGLFDAVCSSNVVDIAGIDGPLDEAVRVLRPGGALLFSDPFYFRDGEAPPGDPRQAIEDGLTHRGLHVEQRQDAVPWVWATYDRHWHLYFNYCLAARRA